MSVDIHDIITCATFCDDRLRSLGVARGRISSFPIDLRRQSYNRSRPTVRVCDRSDNMANSAIHPSGVGKLVVIHVIKYMNYGVKA